MKRKIELTKPYMKEMVSQIKNGKINKSDLDELIEKIAAGTPLDAKYRDHEFKSRKSRHYAQVAQVGKSAGLKIQKSFVRFKPQAPGSRGTYKTRSPQELLYLLLNNRCFYIAEWRSGISSDSLSEDRGFESCLCNQWKFTEEVITGQS